MSLATAWDRNDLFIVYETTFAVVGLGGHYVVELCIGQVID